MLRLNPAVIVAVICVIGLASIYVLKTSNTYNIKAMRGTREIVIKDPIEGLSAEAFKLERNQLSKILNGVKQELAILSCDMIDLKRKHHQGTKAVSATGGWCKKTSFNNSGSHAFDQKLAQQLSIFFKDQRVASFGDGPGDYKRFLDRSNMLKLYDAYDGAPFGPETSGGTVKFLDLTAPQYGLPVYDWVMSLEVAEHIPRKYESIYVGNLVRHAGTGLVLSWARPGQGGLSHVNNRAFEYVQTLLRSKGFEPDLNESKQLQHSATFHWLRNNVFVYRRRSGSFASPDMAQCYHFITQLHQRVHVQLAAKIYQAKCLVVLSKGYSLLYMAILSANETSSFEDLL